MVGDKMILFGYTVSMLADLLSFHAVHTSLIITVAFIVLLSAFKFLSTSR